MWTWIAIAVIAAAVIWWLSARSRPQWEFMRDWVGDPVARREAGRRLALLVNPPLPINLDEDGIRKIRDSLLEPGRGPLARHKLDKIGRASVAVLLEALSDARFLDIDSPEFDNNGRNHPLKCILQVLANHADPEHATHVARLIHHKIEHVRSWAALTLGSLGGAESIAALLIVLRGQDEKQIKSAWTGIDRACTQGRACSAFKGALFNHLVAGCEPGEIPNAPGRLLTLNRARAREQLLAPGLLSQEKHGVQECVLALASQGIGVSTQLLDCLLAKAEAAIDVEDEWHKGESLATLLAALRAVRRHVAEEKLQFYLGHPCLRVQEGAAAALLALAGVPEPWGLALEVAKTVGEDALPVEIQRYLAMRQFVTFQLADGNLGYLSNSSGAGIQVAAAGFRELELVRVADALDALVTAFGTPACLASSDARNARLKQLHDCGARELIEVEQAHHECEKTLERDLLMYALKHVRVFHDAADASGLCRRAVLDALLRLDRPLGEIQRLLKLHPWDSNVALVALESAHISSILRRYLEGALTGVAVGDWANTVEGRDDIGKSADPKDTSRDAVFMLASPEITQELTPTLAMQLLADFKAAP